MSEQTHYLLIGAFAAGHAAQAIREKDQNGRIIIAGLEPHPPYDRPPLSKDSLTDDEFKNDDSYNKPDEYYKENTIEVRPGSKAVRIDGAARTVHFENGDAIQYEKLLIATGATPRVLNVPGHDLDGVFYLRTIEDSAAIRGALKQARRAVVIGGSYMGMEVASGCLQRGLDTTIIEHNGQPWSRFASPQLGQFMREQYEARGAKFLFGQRVASMSGDGRLQSVQTDNGENVETDVCIACTGVTLNTQLAKDAGLEVDEKDGIVVNEYLQTSDPHIWAAGDVACFQDVALGKRWHAEHYMNGQWQGETVGTNMAGEQQPYDKVAYFFSDFLDLHMILRGDTRAGQQTRVLGDMQAGEFIELYGDESGRLGMGVAMSHDGDKLEPTSDKLEELIRAKTNLRDVHRDDFKW